MSQFAMVLLVITVFAPTMFATRAKDQLVRDVWKPWWVPRTNYFT